MTEFINGASINVHHQEQNCDCPSDVIKYFPDRKCFQVNLPGNRRLSQNRKYFRCHRNSLNVLLKKKSAYQ